MSLFLYYKITTRDPLTAVSMASMTVLPICPCLYRGFLWVWCHYGIIQGERGVQICTTSYQSVSFAQMSHMTLLLFWLTVIGQQSSQYRSWTTLLETWIILAKNAGCLLFILFSSSWIDCLNPIVIFGHYHMVTIGNPHLYWLSM